MRYKLKESISALIQPEGPGTKIISLCPGEIIELPATDCAPAEPLVQAMCGGRAVKVFLQDLETRATRLNWPGRKAASNSAA